MKRSRYTGADHRDPEGAGGRDTGYGAVPQARHERSTFYTWKSKYGGLEVNEAKGQAVINRLASMQTPARSRGGIGRRTGLIAWF